MTIFHPDMVWPWPPTPQSHDPMDWVIEWGRFDYERWKGGWQKLFDTHRLAHNRRTIRKIEISKEGDGALAVVDIDTLWIDAAGQENRWQGRVCKVYSKVDDEWKMTMHTGVLDYS
jgi:ketosteroid isomerase-like protein